MRQNNTRGTEQRAQFKPNRPGIEKLENRVLLAYTATGFGPIARFTGDSSSGSSGDVLAFDTSGGLLMHNRASDPGFNSAFDFDSSVAGDQAIAADAMTRVYIMPGGGPDTLIFGNAIAGFQQPASALLAQFEIRQNVDPADGVKVVVDDTTSAVANTFEVAPGRIVATGVNVRYNVAEAYTGIDVIGGSAADTFNVTPSPNVPYSIDGGDPAAAPGDVLNYDANFADATDNGTQITRAGRQPVNYQNVETVSLLNETADASQLVVKNTNNFGPDSLRNAINLANFLPGTNTITFDIPGGGVHTITPRDELPAITDPVVIDGYTQTGATPNTLVDGNNAVLKVVLSGNGSDLTYGLDISAGNSTVRGLVINQIRHPTSNGSDGKGILVTTNGGNTIEGNFIGTDATGTVALGNGGIGVAIASDANIIGGTTPGARNVITDNNLGGVVISFATGNRVEGNFIGTDATGTANLGNNNSGVEVEGTNNTIGGTAAGARNVISGNASSGVTIRFSTSTGNRVEGNFIGTDVTGTAALGNGAGVSISQAANNTIGGTTAGARNIISGNSFNGVFIGFSGATDNRVEGNFIGTDVTGTAALGNGENGVYLTTAANNTVGGATPAHRNVIAGNSEYGIEIGAQADTTRILGNYIGTDLAGNASLPNDVGIGLTDGSNGTEIGGSATGEGNLISGNTGAGIEISGAAIDTRIRGNYIGTDVTGNVLLGGTVGIRQTGAATGTEIGGAGAGEGNLIVTTSSQSSSGISILQGESVIRGNFIGTNAAGTADLTNGRYGIRTFDGPITIGGPNPGERNIISGWSVGISSGSNIGLTVQGNYIGTDVTGTVAVGNVVGMEFSTIDAIIGGTAPGEGNLISGNTSNGIFVTDLSNSAKIYGNLIGTDITGKLPLGNGGNGIRIGGALTYVGGTSPNTGKGNIIAFNAGNGVLVEIVNTLASTAGNNIYNNSIFSNGLLGIDLGGDGVTPNDVGDTDSGPNELVNKPDLTAAFTNTTGVAITGVVTTKDSTAAGYFVQFFASPGNDPSGFGEGKVLLGTLTLFGNGVDIPFAAEFPVTLPAGQVITATTTSFEGTSEFSNAVTVTGNPPQVSIGDVTVTEGDGVPVSATFTITLSAPISAPVTVDFTTADGTAGAPADYLAQTGSVTFDPGQTSRTVTITVNPDSVNEGTETFAVNLLNATIAAIGDGQGIGTILNRNVTPPPPPNGGTKGSIRGFTFNDNNTNGVLDAGDVKISGRTVFLDSNNNGKLDSGEKSTKSATDGSYAFTGLYAGTYYVRRVFPTGYTYSNTPINVALSSGQNLVDANIGSRATSSPPPPPTGGTKGSISGFSFNDSNRNGLLDTGETKTGGKTIFLDTNNNGKLDSGEKSTKSAADGSFAFTGLYAGTYYVRRVFPSGYTYSNTPINIALSAGQVFTGANLGSRTI